TDVQKITENLSDEVLAEARRLDIDSVRAKYLKERDKRLRIEGRDQYVKIAGRFDHFSHDPNAETAFSREPMARSVDVLVIGGGLGGFCVLARLAQETHATFSLE